MFDGSEFMPHGMCYAWRPNVLALHVVSDGLIALAYFSIPLLLVRILWGRPDIPFRAAIWMFSAFIVSCGLTHVASIVVIWFPFYWTEGYVKALTAGLSVATVFTLLPILPRAFAYRSPAELERLNLRLEAAVDEATTAQVQLRETAQQMHDAAVTDALTGISNRRGFDARLDEALADCRRSNSVASLLVIDIDSFKSFNDAFGHPAGDSCLRMVANVIRVSAHRPRDHVARYGGEEFTVIMEHTDAVGARTLAERIRETIEEQKIQQGKGAKHPVVTVSVGVATAILACDMSPEILLFLADQALYMAKANGRNCVVAARELPASP